MMRNDHGMDANHLCHFYKREQHASTLISHSFDIQSLVRGRRIRCIHYIQGNWRTMLDLGCRYENPCGVSVAMLLCYNFHQRSNLTITSDDKSTVVIRRSLMKLPNKALLNQWRNMCCFEWENKGRSLWKRNRKQSKRISDVKQLCFVIRAI